MQSLKMFIFLFHLQSYATDEITQIYDKIAREIEQHLHTVMAPPSTPQVQALHSLLEAVVVARNSKEVSTANALLQKVQFVQSFQSAVN